MSDIPPEYIKMDMWKSDETNDIEPEYLFSANSNIWMNEIIMKTLGHLASQADLQVLRQVNEECYEMLNSIFWDTVDKSISFMFFCDGFRRMISDDSTGTLKMRFSVPKWKKSVMEDGEWEWNEKDTIDKLTITPKNWTPNKAHIYRKLVLLCVSIDKLDDTYEGRKLKAILAQLAPYITTLHLDELPFGSENPEEKFAEFVNTFTNLKNLEIFTVFFGPDAAKHNHLNSGGGVKSLTFDQLEIGLENLKVKPKITLFDPHDGGVLAKFATKQVTIEVNFFMRGLDQLEKLENACTRFGNLKNINYIINTDYYFIANLGRLESFTQVCVQLDGQIRDFNLCLNTGSGSEFQEQDQLGIKNCLTLLSHQITEFKTYSRSWEREILNLDSEWPKLKSLHIFGYKYPLEILKKCSNLEYLELAVDQELCFFANKQQSDVQNLEEYFGNLPNLVRLIFEHVRVWDKIAEGTELDGHLKEILPRIKSLVYVRVRQ